MPPFGGYYRPFLCRGQHYASRSCDTVPGFLTRRHIIVHTAPMRGIIISGSNNSFDADCDDGVLRRCSIKGKKLKTEEGFYNPLCPGDIVELEADELNKKSGRISALVPRTNRFTRWNVKGRLPQLLAANVDLLLCLTTPDEPPFRPRFIDRALAQAEEAGIEAVIVCNKRDLPAASGADVEMRLSDWEALGYRIFKVSAHSGEGLTELAELIEDKQCVLVGQSGVGKSSLINALDASYALKTGELSEKYGRGTHTTVKGVLLRLHIKSSLTGGRQNVYTSVIDTPGVRRFVLHGIEPEDLALYFREMKKLVGSCVFGMSCTHKSEAGCKILEAVHAGAISEQRYESWLRIREELETEGWAD